MSKARNTLMVSSTTKKKSSGKGARTAIWLASGPGDKRWGIAIAMFKPDTRQRSPHVNCQPPSPRVLRAGVRYGDAATMALIELVDRDPAAKGAADKARVEAEQKAAAEAEAAQATAS